MRVSKWPDLRGTHMCYLCLTWQAFLPSAELCEALCGRTGFADLDSTECRGSSAHFWSWLLRLRYTKAQEVSLRDLSACQGTVKGYLLVQKDAKTMPQGCGGSAWEMRGALWWNSHTDTFKSLLLSTFYLSLNPFNQNTSTGLDIDSPGLFSFELSARQASLDAEPYSHLCGVLFLSF